MKSLFSALAILISGIVFSQTSAVTINTTGNRNKQIVVDSKNYTIDNTTATEEQAVVITDLAPGQHTLELIRTNTNNKRTSTKTTFNLRNGYDLTITVAANGSISSSEARTGRGGNNAGAAISTAAFNKLYTQTKNKTSSSARAVFLENEFTTSKRRFTSKQASQLIQLVSSESLRLKVAKLSYPKITDTENFSVVTNLLINSANRNELNAYIALLPADGDDVAGTDGTSPMDDAKFKVIYNEVVAEPTASEKAYYLNNFFSRDFNYYTSAQTRQLIELVPGEQDRLTLAKNAYRGVSDRENYTVVYSLLSSSNRSALSTYINSYDNSNPLSAMTTANFDKLYQSVYSQNSSSSRYTAINNTFTTSGNYFTTAQAKKLITLVSSESNRLQLTKAAYKVLVDRSNYTQFNDLLSSTASRNELSTYVNNYNNVAAGTGAAMSETDYNALYKSVNNAWTSSSKYNLIADAFRSSSSYFTTSQVKQLVTVVSSENDRLSLVKNAWDNIVDQQNYNQLYDLFTSATNRNDLSSFVTTMQNGTGTTAKIAMSDTEFKNMYRELQLTFGIGAKFGALTEIFNKETNYFTVAQAKQLIQMVSSESNRLELAKSSYNNITDPSNFSQLYDIFSSQSSKNELTAYVNSNAYNN